MNALDDPFYYLNNFRGVLDWIGARYGDLLAPSELEFIEAFSGIPRPSQALLVRMVMRKGRLFRGSKLNYPEIGPAGTVVEPLLAKGWVSVDAEVSLGELFGLLTKAELNAHFKPFIDRPDLRKGALFDSLMPTFGEARRYGDWCLDKTHASAGDRLYALTIMAMCDRFRLMFFGNLRQDWSEFVLADLGIYRYETVAFTDDSRAFRKRRDVDAYLHLHHCRERFEAGEPPAAILDAIPGECHDNPWLETRRGKLLFQIAQAYEREGDLATASALYARCGHPEARIRQLRVLERTGQFETALELARRAAQAPESEAEKQRLLRLLPRLHRRLGLAGPARHVPAPVDRVDLTLPRPSLPGAIEQFAAEHLAETGGPVYYVENTLINALFGLLCWDAVFAAVPGAFFHPFHSSPADLLAPEFHSRRASLFAACLAQLDSGRYKTTIRRTFMAKRGIQSPFVQWGGLSEALLEQALACFPPDHLRKWFERLLTDIKANRAGLPDLIQFWPDQRRYRMIEIKGPGDRLQDNQRRWLEFCSRHSMPVTVCYVRWEGSPS